MNVREPAVAYDFGPFRLHPAERLLLRDGAPVPVTPKVFDLLAAFVRDRGRALAKDELLELIWPDTFVEEASLTRTVSLLRQVLGSAGRDYIETVSKFGYRFNAPVREAAAVAVETKSIAVLPFTHAGGGELAYLPVGLADALIARLAHIRRLAVRPLRLDQDREKLQADFVLEGTIRVAADRVRVTAHLVNVTGSIVWSGRFDAAMTDLFTIEDAIAEQIIGALSMRLTAGEQAQLAKRATADAEAYRLYLKGRHFWNKRDEESLRKAIAYFEEAIERDPRYAAAYCGLADSYLLLPAAGRAGVPPARAARPAPRSAAAVTAAAGERDARPPARAAAEKALQIDEELGEAHTTLARIEMGEWNWRAAEERFRRAAELSPDYPTARQWRANLFAATGRFDEAVAEIERARAHDPLSVVMHTAAGWIYYMARRSRESIARYREALEIDPQFAHARRQMAMAYEQSGDAIGAVALLREMPAGDELAEALLAHAYAAADRADDARDTLAKLANSSNASLLQIIAATHLRLGDRRRALEFLQRAVDARASTLMWLKVDPWFDALRGDGAFENIVARIWSDSAK